MWEGGKREDLATTSQSIWWHRAEGRGANELGPGLSHRQRVKVEDNSGWSGAGAESVACGHWREPVPGVLLEALNDGIEPKQTN